MKRFCLAVPLAAAVLLCGCSGGDTVAHLDGHPVSLEEYRQYAYDSISLVSAEYNRTYGADPTPPTSGQPHTTAPLPCRHCWKTPTRQCARPRGCRPRRWSWVF